MALNLHIENIGAIGSIDVKIEGITIIAGENSSGKSTIGKALYSLLHDMSDWPILYEKTCHDLITSVLEQRSAILEDFCMKETGAKRRRTSKARELMEKFSSDPDLLIAIEDFQFYYYTDEKGDEEQSAKNALVEKLSTYLVKYISLYTSKPDVMEKAIKKDFGKWSAETAILLCNTMPDELSLQCDSIVKAFADTFKNQYQRIGEKDSKVSLIDNSNRKIELVFSEGNNYLSSPIRITEGVYYLESPKVFDLLSNPSSGAVQKAYLRYLLSPNIFTKTRYRYTLLQKSDDLEKSAPLTQVENILNSLQSAMGGKAEFYQKVGLEFKDERIKEPIHSVNISAGLKSLALLEYALRINSIMPGDIVILDEPEINLHPSWQAVYAEALVNLQKQYKLKLIVTSHSPYFIRAIEVYSDLNGVMDTLNVYLTQRDKENTVIAENVSYSEFGVSELYERLSAPLEKLESLLEAKYGSCE